MSSGLWHRPMPQAAGWRHLNSQRQSRSMAQQRVLHIGDPVLLPSGKHARVMVAAIPTKPSAAVPFEGQWAVRREHDGAESSYAGLDETDARALAKLLNQVGVR